MQDVLPKIYRLANLVDNEILRPQSRNPSPSDKMKSATTKMQSRFIAFAVAFLLTAQLSADVEIDNERHGDRVSHRLTCTEATDIGKSELKGFLKIVIRDGKIEQSADLGHGRPFPITSATIVEPKTSPGSTEFFPNIRHLPVSSIVAVDDIVGWTIITFGARQMGNGEAWATKIWMPKKALPSKDVFKLLNSITESKAAKTASAEQISEDKGQGELEK